MARTKKTEETPKKVTKPRAKKETKPRASTKKIDDPVVAEEAIIEEPTPAPSYKTMTVKVNTVLNVRSTPKGKIVDQLKNGTKVTIYEEANGWARIGDGRWVFMQYLR